MSFRIEPHAQPVPGYRLMERLGSGGFGEVWKTEAPGGIFKAIKFIHGDLRTKDNDLVRYAEQELKALNRVKTVRHPYLLSLDRIDIVDGRLMIIMELADCNLWDRFRHYRQNGQTGIPRDELLRYMIESAEVLDLMNDTHNLQHLDIKPQNLFLLHQHVKVADFGQVKDLQGAAAEVTGGITPVYAAPETFEGFISKFCDQYSLACVYQELLTGVRPFDGTSLQQLLVQHVENPPNLDPSPLDDRPTLTKALAKKPQDRFPSCMAFVQSLIRKAVPAKPATRSAAISVPAGGTAFDDGLPSDRIDSELMEFGATSKSVSALAMEMTGTPVGGSDTPIPSRAEPEPIARLIAPEETGPGSLRPTLIIGLGGFGLGILRRLRKSIGDQFGSPDRLPLVRTLYIDTDPTDLDAATADLPTDGLPGLAPETVLPARLYRPGHYLKPRLSGRSLLEGWFDSQLIYKLGRVPVTGGNRSFGRLAFCDNFRVILNRVQTEIEKALDPLAYEATRVRTGLTFASNYPRVYLVGGLAGGTAGGMFLDLAYAIRTRLKRLGYQDPDLVGMFLVPPDGSPVSADPVFQANVYAALTELNHYLRPESIFTANFDEKNGQVRDGGRPFRHVYLMPGPESTPVGMTPSSSGSSSHMLRRSGSMSVTNSQRVRAGNSARISTGGTPTPGSDSVDRVVAVADLLRLDMFTSFSRELDNQRPLTSPDDPTLVRTAGLSRYYWSRGEIVKRTASGLTRVVLMNWVTADAKRARDIIPTWTAEAWTRMGLDPEPLLSRLTQPVSTLAGAPIDQVVESIIAPLQPKGWLSRGPDVTLIADVTKKLTDLLGQPVTTAKPSRLEECVAPLTKEIIRRTREQLTESLPRLCDDATLRLSGTEEAANQFIAGIDRLIDRFAPHFEQLESTARGSFERLMAATTPSRSRKATPPDIAYIAKQFATARLQSVLTREIVSIYKQLRRTLVAFQADASACQQRLNAELKKLVAKVEAPPFPRGSRELLPPNCPSTQAAVEAYTKTLTDDDLQLLERRVQSAVVDQFDGLFNACLNTTDGVGKLIDLLQEETRAYLDARLMDVDLVPMLAAQFRTQETALMALSHCYREAEPSLTGPGPWSKNEIIAVASPALGTARNLAFSAGIPPEATSIDSRDEIAYIREWPAVPLSTLPQLGAIWEASYQMACELPQGNPHSRGDVPKWVPIDAG
jgi:serine/threonine protein kinase